MRLDHVFIRNGRFTGPQPNISDENLIGIGTGNETRDGR